MAENPRFLPIPAFHLAANDKNRLFMNEALEQNSPMVRYGVLGVEDVALVLEFYWSVRAKCSGKFDERTPIAPPVDPLNLWSMRFHWPPPRGFQRGGAAHGLAGVIADPVQRLESPRQSPKRKGDKAPRRLV